VQDCFERMRLDCDRISVNLKGDYRAGKSGQLRSKIASVEARVGRKLRT